MELLKNLTQITGPSGNEERVCDFIENEIKDFVDEMYRDNLGNLIAHKCGNGKKVLFVSEKAAALQVVLKRLAEVHLDDFCLALHSHKANKKEILDSIGSNLNLKHARVKESVLADETTAALIREYKKLQVKLQMGAVSGHQPDETDMQRFQGITSLLFTNPEVSRFMLAEMRLQQALADIFRIINEASGVDFGFPGE